MDTTLTQGGIYLAKLNPAKKNEIAKIRPVVVLTADCFLAEALIIFMCPLSSTSDPQYAELHVALDKRKNLHKKSYAIVEQSRSISKERLIFPALSSVTPGELKSIIHKLHLMIEPE